MKMLQHRMLPICVTEHFPHKHADDDEHMGASTITLILTLDFARTRPGPGTDQGRIRNRTCLPCLRSMPRVAVQRTFLPQQDADDDDHTTTMQRLMTTTAMTPPTQPRLTADLVKSNIWNVIRKKSQIEKPSPEKSNAKQTHTSEQSMPKITLPSSSFCRRHRGLVCFRYQAERIADGSSNLPTWNVPNNMLSRPYGFQTCFVLHLMFSKMLSQLGFFFKMCFFIECVQIYVKIQVGCFFQWHVPLLGFFKFDIHIGLFEIRRQSKTGPGRG